MANVRTLKLNLLADTTDFAHGIKKASGQTESFSSSLKSSMKSVAKSAALAGLAVAGMAVAFGVDAVKASIADEKSQKQLALALKNTTKATDKQVKAVEKWITKQQFAYGIADDKLRPALAKLTRATGDVSKAQDLLSLAMDVSAGTGKDLSVVTDALVKAQNGNLGSLKRLGIPLTDAIIKNKDLAAAVDLMSKSYGGAAQTNADTFAGKMEIFNQRISEAKESIGGAILTAIQPFAEKWLPKIAKAVTEVVDGFTGKGGKGGGVALGEAIRNVADAIGGFFAAINTGDGGKQKTMNDNLQGMANAFNNIAGAITTVTKAWKVFAGWLDSPLGRFALKAYNLLSPTSQLVDIVGTAGAANDPNQGKTKNLNGHRYTWDAKKKAWYTSNLYTGGNDYNIDPATLKKLGTPSAKALGGAVFGGRSYYVGEHGPELFTPMGGGSITPNSRLNGGGHTFILNGIIDAESARRAIERVLQQSSIRTGAVNIQGSLI